MKFVLIIPLLLIHWTTSHAQSYEAVQKLKAIEGQYEVDENGNVSYIKIIDSIGLAKDEIFSRVLAFFTYNYTNGESVIQIQDKEAGQIIGKGIFLNVYLGQYYTNLYEYDTWHIVRVDVKDNRVRVIITLNNYRSRNTQGNGIGTEERITANYPFQKKGVAKNHYAMAFLESHKRTLETFATIEKAIREGTVGGAAEKKDW